MVAGEENRMGEGHASAGGAAGRVALNYGMTAECLLHYRDKMAKT